MKTKEEIEQLAEEFLTFHQDGSKVYHIKIREAIEFAYTQCQEDMADISKVTRFEVIDEHGRAYTDHYCKVELSYQDDGRTLKVFIKPLNKQD
jgi:hypothetical protein